MKSIPIDRRWILLGFVYFEVSADSEGFPGIDLKGPPSKLTKLAEFSCKREVRPDYTKMEWAHISGGRASFEFIRRNLHTFGSCGSARGTRILCTLCLATLRSVRRP